MNIDFMQGHMSFCDYKIRLCMLIYDIDKGLRAQLVI
jgi:hypothetical protein